jgi:hypothetical protein
MSKNHNIEAVTDEEMGAYNNFCLDLLKQLHDPLPEVLPSILWHYTTGDTFIRIIESGTLWSTQIACLNDHTEFGYAANLLRSAIREVAKTSSEEAASLIAEALDPNFDTVETHSNGYFVACMSSEDDDLSQWRAYGGGEGGFAIGFDPRPLFASANGGHGFLVRVCYDPRMQQYLANSLANGTVRFYCEGLRLRPSANPKAWQESFFQAWESLISPFAVMLKHEKFASEKEWRFVRALKPEDAPNLQFLQRRTLMSRHLPLKFHNHETKQPLPLKQIRVGPCRYKQISRISAGDLLKKNGYDLEEVQILESEVPFQIT